MKSKREISDLIYNELCYMYCDNCRFGDELVNESACEDCHRKYNGWGVSRSVCDTLAGIIITEEVEKKDAEFKRLTSRDERGEPDILCDAVGCFTCSNEGRCPVLPSAIKRLAAYEDTGLSPEQVTEMAKAQTWVSVGDKLPAENGWYSVAANSVENEKRRVLNAYYWNGNWCGFGDAGVTHWIPKPEPPKEDAHD